MMYSNLGLSFRETLPLTNFCFQMVPNLLDLCGIGGSFLCSAFICFLAIGRYYKAIDKLFNLIVTTKLLIYQNPGRFYLEIQIYIYRVATQLT